METQQKTLIGELNQGKEMAEQLWQILRPSSSPAAGILLIERILSSYEKALSVLNAAGSEEKEVFKKRKLMGKWSEQMKVCAAAGVEGAPEDGYNWRKYGQKDILGARFPRGYFRCSHRFTQGCLATKQVQKSDDDSSMYEVTYKGQHSCNQILHSSTRNFTEKSPKEVLNPPDKHPHKKNPPKQEQNSVQHADSRFRFAADAIRVKAENLDVCFPSPPIRSEIRDDHSPFAETMIDFPENLMENEFVGSLSQSPCESKFDYFFGLCHDADQSADSDLTGFISVPNLSIGDLEEYYKFENLQEFLC